jgi:pyruvate dehydrogenase E2 component (dihydrolipoamide acetyltransferase)
MAISVVMPALELTQESGKLVSWHKKEGDAVAKGETLLEVETDKAVVEVEALADGFLAGISAQAGDVIPVGRTIAWIVGVGETPPQNDAPAAAPALPHVAAAHSEHAHSVSSVAGVFGTSATGISPKARRIAREVNVNLGDVRGSGPGGEILTSDIEAAAKSGTKSPAGTGADRPLETQTAIGRLMAERTTKSWATIPHFFLVREVDVTALNRAREKLNSSADVNSSIKITHTDLLVAIVAKALLLHPRMNSSWTPDGVRLHAGVNMAIAIAVNDGVTAAVIPNAHTASITEITTQRRDLAERAKSGKSRTQDLAGGTFTISNLGMFGVDSFTAIIPTPQAGILAVGAITDRVVAIDGQSAVRSMMTVTLSCDHRVVDGAYGARFLNDVVQAIADPQEFFL